MVYEGHAGDMPDFIKNAPRTPRGSSLPTPITFAMPSERARMVYDLLVATARATTNAGRATEFRAAADDLWHSIAPGLRTFGGNRESAVTYWVLGRRSGGGPITRGPWRHQGEAEWARTHLLRTVPAFTDLHVYQRIGDQAFPEGYGP